jgi:hypothetical protein
LQSRAGQFLSATAKQQEKLLKAKSCTEAYASKHK